jgi:hypothetical protein
MTIRPMEMYGITFTHRIKDGESVDEKFAQFALFAALCANHDLNKFVKNVFYSSTWCGYSIDVYGAYEQTLIGGGIEWAADKTLPQFEIFGRIEQKGCL